MLGWKRARNWGCGREAAGHREDAQTAAIRHVRAPQAGAVRMRVRGRGGRFVAG